MATDLEYYYISLIIIVLFIHISAPIYRDSQSNNILPYGGGSTNSASFRIPLHKRSMESPVSVAAPYARMYDCTLYTVACQSTRTSGVAYD